MMYARVGACQKPDQFIQKTLFLCNNKHFCEKHIFMLFLLYSIEVHENKSVARTFVQ